MKSIKKGASASNDLSSHDPIPGQDLTDKKALEEKMQLLSEVLQQLPCGVAILDHHQKISWANKKYYDIKGSAESEIMGRTPGSVLHGLLTSEDSDVAVKSLIEKAEPFAREVLVYQKPGEPIWIQEEFKPISGSAGKMNNWICIQTDISIQKRAEQTVIDGEYKYQVIFNNSPLPKIIYDIESMSILEVNAQSVFHYGYSALEFLSLSILDLHTAFFRQQYKDDSKLITENYIFHGAYEHTKKNGTTIQVEISASLITYKNKKAVIVIAKDITEKTLLRQQLLEEKSNKERNVLEATLYGQEIERVEIGRELHDNINQMLSVAKMCYEMAFNNEKQKIELWQKGNKILDDTIQELRILSKSLVDSDIKDIQLSESISNLIETITFGRDLKISFQMHDITEDLPAKIKLMLFRIIQEQLNNILKHAEATEVSLEISKEDNKLNLFIQNDGKGFDTQIPRSGIGLNNIMSRVKLFNGMVDIISSPEGGCTLTVKIPMKEVFK